MSQKTVPQLCSELINDGKSKFYLDWLEQVFREIGAREEARLNTNKNDFSKPKGIENLDKALDDDTRKRRMEIKLMIDQRKKEGSQGTANRNK